MPDIEYAFLADAADAVPGQKFNILGGGVTQLQGRSFPLQHPHLALVIGLRVTAAERDREHNLRFVLLGPNGQEVAAADGNIVAGGYLDPRDAVVTFAVDLWNLTLPTPGEYSLRVMVNGSERKALSLIVAQSAEPVQPPPPEQRYLAKGLEAAVPAQPSRPRTGPARHEVPELDDAALIAARHGDRLAAAARERSLVRWADYLEPIPRALRDGEVADLLPACRRARAAFGPRDSIREALPPELTEPFLESIDRLLKALARWSARGD